MNARTAAAFFAALLSVSALVAFAAEVSEPDPSAAAPRESDVRSSSCPEAAAPDRNVVTASTAGESAPAAPATSREKPRPSRRPTWPPPPDLIS